MSKPVKLALILVSCSVLLLLLFLGLGTAFWPLILAAALAYLLFPLVKKLEANWLQRELAVISVFGLTLLVVVLLLILIVPELINDTKIFLQELPSNITKAIDKVETTAENFGVDISLDKTQIINLAKHLALDTSMDSMNTVGHAFKSIVNNFLATLLNVINLVLFPVFFYYIISDYEKIQSFCRKLVPRGWLGTIDHYLPAANRILNGYIRGQLVLAGILACLYSIALAVIGLKFGFTIGFIAGLLSIVPYVGFFIGIVAASTVALASSNPAITITGVLGVFVVLNLLENTYLSPTLVGNKVNLSPLITLIALLVGGNLLGVFGMMIAIPVAGFAQLVFLESIPAYQANKFYKKRGKQ